MDHREDSARAIGLWAGLSGATTALGPFIGGYLVDAVSWRAIFFINVPLGTITAYACVRHVPSSRDEAASGELDWLGAALTVVGLGGVTYALIEGPGSGWGNPVVLGALACGIAALALFPVRELRTSRPMVPLEIFKSRNFTGANLTTLGVYGALSGVLLFLVLNLQEVHGYSPIQAGLTLLPVTILILILSPRMGALMTRFGARLPMTIGPLVVAVGAAMLMIPGRDVSYLTGIFPAVVVFGLGMSLLVTPLTATVMSSISENLAGVASGVSNTMTRVASLLAIAVLGIIVAHQFESSLWTRIQSLGLSPQARVALIAHETRLAADPVPSNLTPAQRLNVRIAIDDSFVDAYRWAMGFCTVLCILSALISAVMIRDEGQTLRTTDRVAEASAT